MAVYRGIIGDVSEIESNESECYFQWSIPDFINYFFISSGFYKSPSFETCDGEWYLEIYPHGMRRSLSPDWMSLSLVRVNNGSPKTLFVTVGVMHLDGVEKKSGRLQEFAEGDNICIWNRFYKRSDLNESKLLPGNKLIITLDILPVDMNNFLSNFTTASSTQTKQEKVEEDHFSGDQASSTQTKQEKVEEDHFSGDQGMEELRESLQRLLTSGEDSDVLIKVQGKEFPAHRAILRARSPVFQAMFAHDMVEKQSGVVTMEDCDPKLFPAFLEHVYTGKTDMISVGNVFNLYSTSDKYDMVTLKKACTEFVKNNLNVSCFCDAVTVAVSHNETELIELATQFFCSNPLDICKTVEWQIFLKENTTVGNELIIKAFSK